MVGWHHQFNRQAPGDSEGQGGLACCSPWSRKEWDTTEQLNNSSSKVVKVACRQAPVAGVQSPPGPLCSCSKVTGLPSPLYPYPQILSKAA